MNAGRTLELRYGSGVHTAAVPSRWRLRYLRTDPSPVGRSEDDIITEMLRTPYGQSLRGFLQPSAPLLILIPDKTRRCGTEMLLPRLLEIVHDAGIPPEHIHLLFASGTHPAQTEEEQRSILGSVVYETYQVSEHDASDENACVEVGITRFGTPVRVNRLVAEASQVIVTGTIVHHYFAGFGGGAKMFVPGTAAYSTAVANHRRTITEDGRFHPRCSDGVIEGNPVIEDILDAQRFMPPHWYAAALLDEHGTIIDGVCGDMKAAHHEGCRKVDMRYRYPVRTPADITIVSPGGYPKDVNFIQSHKALHHASYCTSEGGVIICLAECRDGLGNDHFPEWFAFDSDQAFHHAIQTRYAMNAHTALALREKTRRFRVLLVSSLPAHDVERMGMEAAPDLDSAIRTASQGMQDDADVAVLENGSLVVPKLLSAR